VLVCIDRVEQRFDSDGIDRDIGRRIQPNGVARD
jgi:hypothetical protein